MTMASIAQQQAAAACLAELAGLAGECEVLTDDAVLAPYRTSTFPSRSEILAVVRPASAPTVRAVLQCAARHGVAVHPKSTGKNWGHGCNLPPRGAALVMSFERMNRIVDYDDALGCMTVEPGVTFRQVHDYLKARNAAFIGPVIGSSPDASLIGNALERGIGKGRLGDRFGSACNLEVVLPDGEIIRTGFGRFPHARAAGVAKWGLGPALDGLFSQSNLGVVTQATFLLDRAMPHFQAFFYTIDRRASLASAIDALRLLRLEGTLSTTSSLTSSTRMQAMMQGGAPDRRCTFSDIEEFERQRLRGAQWVGEDVILSPTAAIGRARRKRIRAVLGPVTSQLVFIDDFRARLLGKLAAPLRRFARVDVSSMVEYYENSPYRGIPSAMGLNMCYADKDVPPGPNPNPSSDGVGLAWVAPILPFKGCEVEAVQAILVRSYRRFGFAPNIGYNMSSDRAITCTAAIFFDRADEDQAQRAEACRAAMEAELIAAGCPPYRKGIQGMDEAAAPADDYAKVLARLKTALDPQHVLSPGYYGIG